MKYERYITLLILSWLICMKASTHKSMGMQITASRMEKMQHNKHSDAYLKITDLVLPDGNAGGTEVIIKMPFDV